METEKISLEDRVYNSFKEDTKKHVFEIIKDDDTYVHIRFGRPDSSTYSVNILTSPYHIFYYGDMGSFSFARNKYMLGFFANDRGINPHYWMEKIIASSEPAMEYSQKEIEKSVMSEIENYVESYLEDNFEDDYDDDELDGDEIEEKEERVARIENLKLAKGIDLANEIYSKMMDEIYFEGDGEYFMVKAIQEIIDYTDNDHPDLNFQDFWEYGNKEYSYRYLWCCYALNHIGNEYFKIKDANENV